jgi:hypothetical protein
MEKFAGERGTMRYLLGAVALIALGGWLWFDWRRWRDPKRFLVAVGLVGSGIFFTLLTRSMIVYKPLMVIHIAATLLFWYAVALYLLRRRVLWPLFAAPAVTMALFFAVAWLFREV